MIVRQKDFEFDFKRRQEREEAYISDGMPPDEAKELADQETVPWFTVIDPPHEFCFVCGEKLTIPAIVWSGGDSRRIWMHPQCADRLCVGLMRDVKEFNEPYK